MVESSDCLSWVRTSVGGQDIWEIRISVKSKDICVRSGCLWEVRMSVGGQDDCGRSGCLGRSG